jgi:hypothetical protein
MYLVQRREHLSDRVSDQDLKTNTNVETLKNTEDKANEIYRFSKPNR